MISLDKFYPKTPFTSIGKKEQILKFLNHQEIDGKWVERKHDADGKYVSSFNCYLKILMIFFSNPTVILRTDLRKIGKRLPS
jgi:hypothetical protein